MHCGRPSRWRGLFDRCEPNQGRRRQNGALAISPLPGRRPRRRRAPGSRVPRCSRCPPTTMRRTAARTAVRAVAPTDAKPAKRGLADGSAGGLGCKEGANTDPLLDANYLIDNRGRMTRVDAEGTRANRIAEDRHHRDYDRACQGSLRSSAAAVAVTPFMARSGCSSG